MRELGLTLFLAVVGINAGAEVVDTLKAEGVILVLAGAVITLVPMILITLFCRFRYHYKIIELIGIISGGMTSTPGLAVGSGMTNSQTPVLLYATVYPFAMILMMIFSKILVLLN
jgi:putative transport protein